MNSPNRFCRVLFFAILVGVCFSQGALASQTDSNNLRCELAAVGLNPSSHTFDALSELQSSTPRSKEQHWGFLTDRFAQRTLAKLEEIGSVPSRTRGSVSQDKPLNQKLFELINRYSITLHELQSLVLRTVNVSLHTHIAFALETKSGRSLHWLVQHIRGNLALARLDYESLTFLNSLPASSFEEIFKIISEHRGMEIEPTIILQSALKIAEDAMSFDIHPNQYRVGTITVATHKMTAKEQNELIPLPVVPIQIQGSYFESEEKIESNIKLWSRLLEAYRATADEFPLDPTGINRYMEVQAAYQRALQLEPTPRRRVVLTWTYHSLLLELNDDIARGAAGAIRLLQRLGPDTPERTRFTNEAIESLSGESYFSQTPLEAWELFIARNSLIAELKKTAPHLKPTAPSPID
jgi:hypothetical protein